MPIYEAQMLREEDRLDDARAALERAHLDSVFGFDVRQRLAGLDCDQGQPEEGLGRSRSARAQLPAKPRPLQEAVASAIEAGCLLARGDFAEALPSLRRGHELGIKRSDWNYPSRKWVRDCERLIQAEKQLPDVLAGKSRPADARERIGWVRVCLNTQRYAAAARVIAASEELE